MRNRYYKLLTLTVLAVLAGCDKENTPAGGEVPEGALRVVAEGAEGTGSKVTVDGKDVYWQNNEPVRVNDNNNLALTIEQSGNQYTAYIRNLGAASTKGNYYVMTPPNLSTMTTADIDEQYFKTGLPMARYLTINAPREYIYKEFNPATGPRRQVIEGLPMYGKAEANDGSVTMKHLTVSIRVELTNEARRPVMLDSIVVSVSGNKCLSGVYKYLIRQREILSVPVPDFTNATEGANKSVRMNFSTSATTAAQRTIGAGVENTKWVQVPIMPLPKNGQFGTLTIKVYGKTKWDGYEGTTMYQGANPAPGEQFCIERSVTPTSGTFLYTNGIKRNQLFSAPMTITSEDAGTDKGIFTFGSSASAPKGVILLSESSTPPDNTYRLLSKIEMQWLLDNRGDENTARFVVINRRPSGEGGYVKSALCIFPDGVQISDLPSEVHPYVNTNEVPQHIYQLYQLVRLNPDWAKGCFVLPLIDYSDIYKSYTNYRHQVGNEWLYAEMKDNYTPAAYTWTEPEFWGSRYCGWFYDRYLYVKTLP